MKLRPLLSRSRRRDEAEALLVARGDGAFLLRRGKPTKGPATLVLSFCVRSAGSRGAAKGGAKLLKVQHAEVRESGPPGPHARDMRARGGDEAEAPGDEARPPHARARRLPPPAPPSLSHTRPTLPKVCYALARDAPSGACWVVSSDAGERSFPSLDAFLESVKHRARVGLRFRRLERSAKYVVDDAAS